MFSGKWEVESAKYKVESATALTYLNFLMFSGNS
ncbi:hypothetical protein SAMN04488023_12219 [Pedobacter rhizosphaerae]|uniref:Uncharacterized protein n=1 Tax=Pedobacter rhizosphaerae TaxID=390241 RepID=A0A1H9TEP7_9SPHI|nr:hypothetical protein SAMN04488023_12219 [Pedobacter rhizosphaerae]